MSNIVHRLRTAIVLLDAEREEAAAEIERLQRENELLSAAMSSDGAAACGQLAVAEAEVERLRDANKKQANMICEQEVEIERLREVLAERIG